MQRPKQQKAKLCKPPYISIQRLQIWAKLDGSNDHMYIVTDYNKIYIMYRHAYNTQRN